MAQILIEGSRGEEVRRLQGNLNVALAKQKIILDGQNILPLEPDGKFGRRFEIEELYPVEFFDQVPKCVRIHRRCSHSRHGFTWPGAGVPKPPC
jgi:hypothetical protein